MSKGFKGGGGGVPGNMQALVKQAQKMKKDLEKAQEEAKTRVIEVQVGGGTVSLKMDGRYEIHDLTIAKEAIDPEDKEMLEDLIKAAFAEAITKVQSTMQGEVEKLTGGINIPGLF